MNEFSFLVYTALPKPSPSHYINYAIIKNKQKNLGECPLDFLYYIMGPLSRPHSKILRVSEENLFYAAK